MADFGEMVLQNMHLTPREEKFFVFRIKCLLYDFSKLAIFLVFFGLMHRLDCFLLAYAVMFPLRQASGGLHFKHYISCLIFSFGFFAADILLLVPVTLPVAAVCLIFPVCAAISYAIGPIQAPTRPPLAEQEIAKHRKKALAAFAYAAIITVILYQFRLESIGYWTIILQTLQLIIAFIKKKGGETHV